VTGAVEKLAVDEKNTRLYVYRTGGFGGAHEIRDARSGALLLSPPKNKKVMMGGGSLSPDGEKLIAAGNIPYIKPGTNDLYSSPHLVILSTATGDIVFQHPTHDALIDSAPRFDPSGKLFAVPDADQVHIWDMQKLTIVRRFAARLERAHGYHGIAFVAGGKSLLSMSSHRGSSMHPSPKGTTRLWDFETGRLLREIRAVNATVTARSVDPAGKHVLTTTDRLRLWSLETDAPPKEYAEKPVAAEFLPGGRTILARYTNGPIRLLNADTGEIEAEYGTGDIVTAAIVNSDGTALFYAALKEGLVSVPLERKLANMIAKACGLAPIKLNRNDRLALKLAPEPEQEICSADR
jgi:WD40 repeat protein